jgi:prepilin-type processing-associated H-X9-DG protein
MYIKRFKMTQCVDGLSKTLMVGEVIDGHKPETTNVWSRAVRSRDSVRYADNPLNTWPPDNIGASVPQMDAGVQVGAAFASRHTGGCQFVFGDGHVQLLKETIDQDIYEALSTRDASLWPYNYPEPQPTDY